MVYKLLTVVNNSLLSSSNTSSNNSSNSSSLKVSTETRLMCKMVHLVTSTALLIVGTTFSTCVKTFPSMTSSAGLARVAQARQCVTSKATWWQRECETQANPSLKTSLSMVTRSNNNSKMITNVSFGSRFKRLRIRKSGRRTRWLDLTCCRSKRFRRSCRIWMRGNEPI